MIEVESVELEGWPFPRAGPDHRSRPLDGRPLPLLLQLAPRRPAPVRRLRPRQPEADRPALARRRARQADRRRPRAERRPADAPALLRRPPALRHQLALLDLGQPVLSRSCARGCCASTATPTAAWRSTRTSSSTSTTGPAGLRAHTRCASRAATARRRSSSDRRPCPRAPRRGERAAARAGRRSDGDGGRGRRPDVPRPATTPATGRASRDDAPPIARRSELAAIGSSPRTRRNTTRPAKTRSLICGLRRPVVEANACVERVSETG